MCQSNYPVSYFWLFLSHDVLGMVVTSMDKITHKMSCVTLALI